MSCVCNTFDVEVTVGDDWEFTFTAVDVATALALSLAGYTPGGVLWIPPLNTQLAINGSMVDTSQLANGIFSLNIPRAVTTTLAPAQIGYRLQVYLIDTSNKQRTYGNVILEVGV